MRTTIKALLLSSMLLCSANADFLMTLTDKNGVEENLCVKNYSFSNTLESLHKQENQMIDEYSTTKEVLTNKRWDGKPVYRRVFKDLKGFIDDGQWRNINFNNEQDNVEYMVSAEANFGNNHEHYSVYAAGNMQFRYVIKANTFHYISDGNYVNANSAITVVMEYTKTTDTAQSSTNELTTMVHYLPSNSSTDEYITKSLDETGIRFLKNYRYDENTNSCVKN